ncbi:MAG: hypothetical protein K2N12_08600 [Helicobacter sp.]|nr:hypothetical protein [Helicobacter sp.]
MADETLSTKIDRILAEYDKIITASTQTKERYTEIVAIRDSIATLKNTLTNDITTAKSQIKEASDTFLTRLNNANAAIEELIARAEASAVSYFTAAISSLSAHVMSHCAHITDLSVRLERLDSFAVSAAGGLSTILAQIDQHAQDIESLRKSVSAIGNLPSPLMPFRLSFKELHTEQKWEWFFESIVSHIAFGGKDDTKS